MKTASAMFCVALISVAMATTAFATEQKGGFFVGVKGGYNSMDYPTGEQTLTDAGNTLVLKASKDTYIVNIHGGYTWPIADEFQLGGQLGYSNYGQYKVSGNNSSNTGTSSLNLQSLNLLLVGQYDVEKWFVEGRVGSARMIPSESGAVTNNGTGYKADSKNHWDVITGASIGYYFNENLSMKFFYDHIFGKAWTWQDFGSEDGNQKDAPASIDSFGLGLTWRF